MSKRQDFIVLTPPSYLHLGKGEVEEFMSFGHTCPHCHGNGWFWGIGDDGLSCKVPCTVCEGSGLLDASVRVVWRPRGSKSF